MTTNFWDADGDFDYEAHYEAGQLENAATVAQSLGAPELAQAIHYFALKDLPRSSFTPELFTALKTWQHLVNEIENAPVVQDVKELRRQAEDTGRAIENLTEAATG